MLGEGALARGLVGKEGLKTAEVKVPPITLGEDPSGTAGQKTLRDAPVVVKLRRKVAAFFGYFFLLLKKSDWLSGHPRRSCL